MMPIEQSPIKPEVLYQTSLFYMFLLGYLMYFIIASSFKYNELNMMTQIIKYQEIIRKINYRFNVFDNNDVDIFDLHNMIRTLDNYSDSESSESDSSESDSSESESDSDSLNDSDEEVEKAGLILYGMSKGKNWVY